MGVVYLCLSYSSDDHHLLHSSLGTGARVGTQKDSSLKCIYGSSGIFDRPLAGVGVQVSAVFTILPFLV